MSLQISPANKFSRIIAKIIDYSLLFSTIILISNLFFGESKESIKLSLTVIPIILLLLKSLYFVILNSKVGGGQTLGKKLLNIEVKKISNKELRHQSILESIIRQFCFDGIFILMYSSILIHSIWGLKTSFFSYNIFELLCSISVLLVFITFILSPIGIALHDLLASTIVVSKEAQEANLVEYDSKPPRKIAITTFALVSMLIISAHFVSKEQETQKFAKLFRTHKYVFEKATDCQIPQMQYGKIKDNNIAKTEESIVVEFFCDEENPEKIKNIVKKIVSENMSKEVLAKRQLAIRFFDPTTAAPTSQSDIINIDF